MDSVLCFSEEEAEKYISAIGKEYIHFQENNDDGTVIKRRLGKDRRWKMKNRTIKTQCAHFTTNT